MYLKQTFPSCGYATSTISVFLADESYKKENDANNSGNLNPGDNLTNVAQGETYIFYIDNDFIII